MKSKFGTFLIIAGCLMVVSALALFLYNHNEQVQAASASQQAIPKVVEAIQVRQEQEPEQTISTELTAPPARTMAVVEIDGYGYIGFLSIPSLGLELPVMTDWTYPQLQIAPCRYSGSTFTDDLVIMAHNYPKHFGQIRNMRQGDSVTFTDMDGEMYHYQVAALDVLNAEAVEDMTAGEFDLTLFTCSYGGKSRVTVRCDQVFH